MMGNSSLWSQLRLKTEGTGNQPMIEMSSEKTESLITIQIVASLIDAIQIAAIHEKEAIRDIDQAEDVHVSIYT